MCRHPGRPAGLRAAISRSPPPSAPSPFSGATGGIALNSGGGTINTAGGDNTSPSAYGGIIAGTNPFTKDGAGTLTLGGASTFTGGTVVSAGTLTLNSGASLAATGALTIDGGTLNLNNASQTIGALSGAGGTINFGTGHVLTLAQITATSYSGIFSGAGSIVLNGAGATMTLSGGSDNTYSGDTTVNEGTLILAKTAGAKAITGGTITVGNGAGTDILRLGASNQIANSANLVLSGGSFQLGNFSAALGSLKLNASSTIDFGSTAATLVFANSAAQSWTGTLTINNYTTGSGNSLQFGTSAAGLTAGQLAQISFTGYAAGAAISAAGMVTPVPEPATCAVFAGFLALILTGWARRGAPRGGGRNKSTSPAGRVA